MRLIVQHSRCRFVLVMALLLSSVPRVGCINPDGTHLPYCEKVVDVAVNCVASVLQPSPKEEGCSCCAERRAAMDCQHGMDTESPDPCDCDSTIEGPEWASTESVEVPAPCAVPVAIVEIGLQTFDEVLSLEILDRSLRSPPQCIALGAMRLNV